ncbi:MAG: hypothetical protein ACXIVQ_03830 [Acidimicrobiales bacterium]
MVVIALVHLLDSRDYLGLSLPLIVVCVVSYVVTPERGIYSSQRVDTPKVHRTGD